MKKIFFLMSAAVVTLLASCSGGSGSSAEWAVDYVSVNPDFRGNRGGNKGFALANPYGDVIELPENMESVSASVNGIFRAREAGNNDYYFWTAEASPKRIGEGYRKVGAFTGKYAPVVNNDGNIQYIDREGKVAFDLDADNGGNFFDGRALVKVDKLYGYIGEDGKLAIPARYVKAGTFSEGYAVVWKDQNEWAVIDTNGKEVLGDTRDHSAPNLDGAVKREQVQDGYLVAISPDRKEHYLYHPSDPGKSKTDTYLEGVRIYSNVYDGKYIDGLGVHNIKEKTIESEGQTGVLTQFKEHVGMFTTPLEETFWPEVEGYGKAVVVSNTKEGMTYLLSPNGNKTEAPIFLSGVNPVDFIYDMVKD